MAVLAVREAGQDAGVGQDAAAVVGSRRACTLRNFGPVTPGDAVMRRQACR